jgi:hypothetical protein
MSRLDSNSVESNSHCSSCWSHYLTTDSACILSFQIQQMSLDQPVCMLPVSDRLRFKNVTPWRRPAGVSKACKVLGFIPPPGHAADICCCTACRYVLLQTENMLDMMNVTSGLTTNCNRRVNNGQASSCHSEPKGGGPQRLYNVTLCRGAVLPASDSIFPSALEISGYVQPYRRVLQPKNGAVLTTYFQGGWGGCLRGCLTFWPGFPTFCTVTQFRQEPAPLKA